MTYTLGTVGLGHWVKRLHEVLGQKQEIKLVKTVGTRSFDDKREELEKYGISEDKYYRVDAGNLLPESFFEGLDVIHIASPNQFHKTQLIQSLNNDKVTIVEKAFATNKKDFDEVLKFIRDNSKENKIALHLHYLTKALTVELGKRLPVLINKYGKITGISAAFLEKLSEEDARRSWLFKPENGGIFMDWIHPISIVANILKAELKLIDCRTFIVQPEYDNVNPTAVEAVFKVTGRNFQPDATFVTRVGKGFDASHKKFRIYFERATVDLRYLSTEEEIITGKRGEMKIDGEIIVPSGPLSYEIMINEMLEMLNGRNSSLSLEEIEKIYDAEWQFQEFSKKITPETNKDEIQKFVQRGLANEI